MEPGKIIAVNLRELRTKRNLTFGQLSQLCGISKAMLAEIEKGNSNPTIGTLLKIANGLNVPYTRLMKEIPEDATVVREKQAVMQFEESNHYRISCYFKTTETRNFEFFSAELDPESSYLSVGHPPKAQEYIYVISGNLQLCTSAGTYSLLAGDALRFASSVEHTYVNPKKEPALFLIINHYHE